MELILDAATLYHLIMTIRAVLNRRMILYDYKHRVEAAEKGG